MIAVKRNGKWYQPSKHRTTSNRRRWVSKEQKHMKFLFIKQKWECCMRAHVVSPCRTHTHTCTHAHTPAHSTDKKLPGPYEEPKPHTWNLETLPTISGRALLQAYLLLGPGWNDSTWSSQVKTGTAQWAPKHTSQDTTSQKVYTDPKEKGKKPLALKTQ